jgi:transposase
MYLSPPFLKDWLPEGHLAYFVSDLVDHLDLSATEEAYEREERCHPPYHQRMMVKVLLYAECVGVRSSGKIEKRLEEDEAFRVLGAGNTLSFRTIAQSRSRHLKEPAGLFVHVLTVCEKSGLVSLKHVALTVQGVRQSLLRGRLKVRAEWLIVCTAHNILKRFGSGVSVEIPSFCST